jgi:putative ABC transport system permease protein
VADNLAVARPDAGARELGTALDRVALDPGLLGQDARTLSDGELQRMCLARTLVTGPETLLLDEPTSALDEQPKLVFESAARGLAAQGVTIIWVTHDKAQAARVADRIYQLRARPPDRRSLRRDKTVNTSIGWAGLAVSLLLVAVAAGISWWQRLGLQRQILISAARALVQLLLVGAALTLVLSPGRSIWWSWLWVAAMLGYASVVARRRAPEVPHLLGLALASFTAAAVVTLGVLFGLHVFPLTGRTLVPIAGMMIGNSMTATVLAGRRLTDELRDKRDEVEARLALGQPSRQAATPYVCGALRAALTPQIETTKATGLVFLPGAMTGLILAGTAPLQAVLVQAVVMFLVLAATATTTAVIALGLIRRLFTPDHRLVHLPAPADR